MLPFASLPGLLESAGLLLLDSAVKGLVIVATAALLTMLMRRAAAAWRHPVWSSAAIALLILPLARGWDQSSSEIRIRTGGESKSLFYQSKSIDGRPQNGMSDHDWEEVRKPLTGLMQQVYTDGKPTTLARLQAETEQQPAADVPNPKVSVNAKAVAWSKLLGDLCDTAGVKLEIDREAMRSINLPLDAPVTVVIDQQPLEQAARRVVWATRNRGVFVKLVDGKTLLVTSMADWQQRVAQKLPDWLRPLQNNGMVAHLEGDQVVEIYLGNVADDQLLAKLQTLPTLRLLNIETTKNITAQGLADLGGIESLESLKFYSVDIPSGSLDFLTQLKSLRELSITEAKLTDETMQPIGKLAQLRVLKVGGNHLTDAAMSYVKNLTNLEVLSLPDTNWVNSDMSITDAGLANISGLIKLRELDISGLPITDDGIRQLSRLAELRTLRLSGTAIEGDGLEVLENFPHLQSLVLGGAVLSDSAMPHVAKCGELQFLQLGYTSVTDEGFREIARLKNLERLSLDSHRITDRGIESLASAKHLKHIELRVSDVSDAALAHLSRIESLIRLDLSGSGNPGVSIGRNFTGAGYSQLARLPNLKTLYLYNADVSWTELSSLKQLDTLNMMMPTMSHDDVRALQKALPNTSVSAAWGGSSISPDGQRGL